MRRLAVCPICRAPIEREFEGIAACRSCGARLIQDKRRDTIWSTMIAVPIVLFIAVGIAGFVHMSIVLAAIAAVLGIAYLAWPYLTTYREGTPDGFCPVCGYDLRETHGPNCSECGAPIWKGPQGNA